MAATVVIIPLWVFFLLQLFPSAVKSFLPQTRNRMDIPFSKMTTTTTTTTTTTVPPPSFSYHQLFLKASSSSTTNSNMDSSDRANVASSSLIEWAKENGIAIGKVRIDCSTSYDGLGIIATEDIYPNELLLEIPTRLALTAQSPKDYNSDAEKLFQNRNTYRQSPWWAQLSIQLNILRKIDSTSLGGNEMKPWLDSLPYQYSTPFHWSKQEISELQYPFIQNSIYRQRKSWSRIYDSLLVDRSFESSVPFFSYQDFVWGSECARSRAFSGSYAGDAFNPLPYALTLFLITAYVGLGIGTLDQAANGAALVVCGVIFKDFIFPKLSGRGTDGGKKQKYVICPLIDMANHVGKTEQQCGLVAFEYFTDGYSLSVPKNNNNNNNNNDDDKNGSYSAGTEILISYGTRSNDQLLQYYGFVEIDNPHDVYIMPPLGEWNIQALEETCGRSFGPGRLKKLERAGLLGQQQRPNTNNNPKREIEDNNDNDDDDDDDDGPVNTMGGVVLTRSTGSIDPAILTALRALISTEEEWTNAQESISSFVQEYSIENERLVRKVIRKALEMELDSMATTLEEDEEIFKSMEGDEGEDGGDGRSLSARKLGLLFRMEKKKLLKEIIRNYT